MKCSLKTTESLFEFREQKLLLSLFDTCGNKLIYRHQRYIQRAQEQFSNEIHVFNV